MRAGLLVAFEGVDGSGKSTALRSSARRLRRSGWSVATWREPTRPALGRAAQSVAREDPVGGAMYFTIDRLIARERLERLVAEHDVVLSDRSFYSTLAYQGSAVPPKVAERLRRLQQTVARHPDRVLWFDLPARIALARVSRRGRSRAPLERLRTLDRVARAYRRLARAPGWERLDARAAPAQLARDAASVIDAELRRKRRRKS